MVSYLALSVPSTRLSLLFVYPDQPPRLTPLISISGDLAYRLSHLQPLDLRWEGRMKVRETRGQSSHGQPSRLIWIHHGGQVGAAVGLV